MKYLVEVKHIEIYHVEVDAETEREAYDKADELLENDKFKYHYESEIESEIIDD